MRWNPMMNIAYVSAELAPFDTEANVGKMAPPVKLDEPGRRMLHDQMIRLWEDMPPDVIILDQSFRWPLKYISVEWQQVFSNDAGFNRVMSQYRPVLEYQGERMSFVYLVHVD